uniref:Uncharacterized protein n=1 Tax=Chrysotila carterae TaxID=13221 RepID=A0A7S4B3D6_CHRCT|mmetsp:Transcript_27557/g.60442  ORF Transcript_27557/g.60442 Transcript_27557/m.60442 type:complete len:456 (+) Transcript_27557:286-1653(+)
MASSFRRLRGLPGAELEARSSSPHCALPRNGGSGLVPPRTPHRPPQAASSQLAEGLEASSELRLASLLQLVNPASRTASPTPGPTQEKMPGPEMLEASSNAEGETDDAPAQVAAPLSDAHAQQQHARQVEALVRALRKKPVASTGQCSRRASGDYASADTATLPSCGSKTSENGVQGPETAPTIARHAAAAADEAAEAEEEVEGGVETEEAAVVGRLDNLFATLNRCRASLDAQAQLSTGALETSEQDPGTSSAPSAACSGGGGSGNGGGADILVLWPSDSATPECAAAAPSSSGVSLSEATLDRVKGAPAGLNFDSTHFESHQLASRGCSSRGISSGGSVWIDYEQQRSTTEMLQEAFPAHVALLFASDSWELREMAIDRMETALCEQEPQGESLARPSTANILRSRASLMNGDAETSALEDEQSDEGSSNEGQQPRFWAKVGLRNDVEAAVFG